MTAPYDKFVIGPVSAMNVLAVMDAALQTVAGFDDADHADDGDEPIIAPLLANMREARAAVAEVRNALASGCGDGGLSERACAALLARLGGAE